MASGQISAFQVGSYFVGQYYQVLQNHPELVHQFYNQPSKMIRVDGDSTEVASTILDIHTSIMSLDFTGIEITTINALDSWNGGLLVMVTGLVKTREFSRKRKFAQSFFLAPQEKGYFVHSDIFHFIGEELGQHDLATVPTETKIDTDLHVSNALQESSVTELVGEEAIVEYVESLNINDDSIGQYYVQDQQWNNPEPAHEVYETYHEEPAAPLYQAVNEYETNHNVASVEEPAEEPQKKTYASILRLAKAQAQQKSLATAQPSSHQAAPSASEWDYIPQPSLHECTHVSKPAEQAATEDVSAFEDGVEFKSVYVRNLPFSITSLDLEQEFQNFGTIKPDGIFIRSRPETGVCYAFVEFEELSSVQNAIQASPIQLGGNRVYIEERRANPASIARGGRRGGRGRTTYNSDAPRGRYGGGGLGRGSYQDNEYGRQRGNGFYQRG